MVKYEKSYVLGFITCLETKEILLIKKNKPEFQKGFYNGLGGKIEQSETPEQALVREIREECGIITGELEWKYFCSMSCPEESIDKVSKSWIVYCYIINLPKVIFRQYEQKEEELLQVFHLSSINITNTLLLGNITWLVGMGIDQIKNKAFDCPTFNYTGLSLPIKL